LALLSSAGIAQIFFSVTLFSAADTVQPRSLFEKEGKLLLLTGMSKAH